MKAVPLLAVLLAALLLSACDRCGDPIRALGGNAPTACKN
jgi:hypothetical protein